MAAFVRGLMISVTGLVGSAQGIYYMEQHQILRHPKLTVPVLFGIAGGWCVLGAGYAFFTQSKNRLIYSGLLRAVVENSWKTKTTLSGKPVLRGRELLFLVRSITRTEPFISFTRMAHQGRSFNSFMCRLVEGKQVQQHLVKQVEPFFSSEKVVADRLKPFLGKAVHDFVLEHIQAQQFKFTMLTLSFLVSSFGMVFSFDQNLILPSESKKWQNLKRLKTLQKKGTKADEQQQDDDDDE